MGFFYSVGEAQDLCQEKEADCDGEAVGSHDDHLLDSHREGHDQEQDPFPERGRVQRKDAEQEIDDGAGPSASVKEGGDIVRNDIGDPDARGQGQIADGRVQGSVAIGIFLCLIPVYRNHRLFLIPVCDSFRQRGRRGSGFHGCISGDRGRIGSLGRGCSGSRRRA